MKLPQPLVIAIAVVAACRQPPPPPPESQEAEPAAASSAETHWFAVTPATDQSLLEAAAWTVAAPGSAAEVTTPVRGRIEQIHTRPGDSVRAGAPLIVLRAPELVSAIAARNSAQRRIVAYEKHVRELAGLRRDGLMRAAELFAIEAQLADIQAEKSKADAVLRGAGLADADIAEVQASGLWTLRAPMAGVVRAVVGQLGGLAEPGGPPLVQLVAERPARVEVHLQQPLPPGVRVRFESTTGLSVPLQAAVTATAIDPKDGSQIRWFEPETSQFLPADLRGRLVVTAMPDGAVQVPARALVQQADGVAVVEKGPSGVHFCRVQVLAVAGTSAIVRGVAVGAIIAAEADRSPLAKPPGAAE